MGLFMFEVRSRKFYVPVMYSNGELKGADLLYDHAADRFVPNKDNWVDHILSQSPAETGFAADQDESELDITTPQVSDLFDNNPYKSSNVPLIGAAGLNNLTEEKDDIVVEEDESIDEDEDTPATDSYTDKSDIKDASISNRIFDIGSSPAWGSLTDFFRNEDGSFASKFAQTLMQEPELHKAVHSFYGNDIYEALSEAKFAQDSLDLPKVASDEPKVKVITSPMDPGVSDILNEEEIQSLVEEGIAFVDNRDGDEKSIPYKVETTIAVSGPPSSGMYSVLMKGGKFEKMYLFTNLLGNKVDSISSSLSSPGVVAEPGPAGGDKTILALPKSGKTGFVISPKDILVQVTEAPNTFVAYIDNLADVSSVKNSRKPDYSSKGSNRDINLYVFIDPNTYQATPPLAISNKVTSDGVTNMEAYSHSIDTHITNISISDKYKGLSYLGGTLYVNPKCKSVEVIQPEWGNTPILGNQNDLDRVLTKDFEDIKVSCVGHDEYHVFSNNNTTAFCRYKKALTTLVGPLGLDVSEARQLLTEARQEGKKVASYKIAGPADIMYPSVEEGAAFAADPRLGVTEQTSAPQFIPAMESGSTDPQAQAIQDSITGMNQSSGPMSSQSVQEILQAAETGEREVFDTATISNLLDSNEIDALLTRFTKDLDIALDRLGRLNFLLMLHRNKFIDRFGSDDIMDMEDSLNNTFKGLGELILKLKEREISSDAGFAVETDLEELV